MKRLFTSEAVSEGHPDKVADQISDAILDNFLKQDRNSHVAVETLVTTGQVVVAGEVRSNAYVDIQGIVRNTINRIGYTKSEYQFDGNSCGILSAIHEQSQDISRGVDQENQGAGDQGIMFGYACNETKACVPAAHYLANLYMQTLAEVRRDGRVMDYLRPDSKSQVTMELDALGRPQRIDTILISTQHDEFASDVAMHEVIQKDVFGYLTSRVVDKLKDAGEETLATMLSKDFRLLVNPTGKFVIGGPHGDTGLTGRKIICDTYGGYGAHGGGAFSGKDPSKVDRSAAYAARYIAKNLVANNVCEKVLIQLSYAIGVAEPVSINVKAEGINKECSLRTNELIADYISQHFDLTPAGIEKLLRLKAPIYEPTAAYGHFGREPYEIDGVVFFPWEKVVTLKDLA